MNSAADHYSPILLGWSHTLQNFTVVWLQKQMIIIYQHIILEQKKMMVHENNLCEKV